jgi:hypothetical protein
MVWLTAIVLLTATCARPAAGPPADLPTTLTVLVQEDPSFYYRNETDHWVAT